MHTTVLPTRPPLFSRQHPPSSLRSHGGEKRREVLNETVVLDEVIGRVCKAVLNSIKGVLISISLLRPRALFPDAYQSTVSEDLDP